MASLQWTDADEIGFQLSEKFPQTDPLSVAFPELHKHVTELDEFAGDRSASNEGILEAIQMAWLEYFRENNAG